MPYFTNERQSRPTTLWDLWPRAPTWVSPSSGYTYATASDSTITQTIAPMPTRACWLKSSLLVGGWRSQAAHERLYYSTGRFGQSISDVDSPQRWQPGRDHLQHWQTRAASAHYQVEANGTVGQLRANSNTAWHAGNWTVTPSP